MTSEQLELPLGDNNMEETENNKSCNRKETMLERWVYNSCSYCVDNFMTPVHKWPPFFRKLYLLTLPISLPLRVIFFVLVISYIAIVGIPYVVFGAFADYFYRVWKGKANDEVYRYHY